AVVDHRAIGLAEERAQGAARRRLAPAQGGGDGQRARPGQAHDAHAPGAGGGGDGGDGVGRGHGGRKRDGASAFSRGAGGGQRKPAWRRVPWKLTWRPWAPARRGASSSTTAAAGPARRWSPSTGPGRRGRRPSSRRTPAA